MVTLRAQKLKNGSYSLYLDIYRGGQRMREYLNIHVSKDYTKPIEDKAGNIILDGFGKPKDKRVEARDKENWELAKSIRMKRELEMNTTQHGFVASFKKSADLITYFENLLPEKKHHTYKNTLSYLKDFAGNKLSFKAIDESFLTKFQTFLAKELSNNTALIYMDRLNIILNQAIKDKIILSNPIRNIKRVKRTDPKRTFLDIEEVRVLHGCLTEVKSQKALYSRKAFLFACFTGLRLSDVRKLSWAEVKKAEIQFRQQKSQKELQHIPLSRTGREILDSLDKSEDKRVFFNMAGDNSLAELHIQAWAKQAGITKHITFHVSRHTFATMALTNGVDLYTVSKLLGHADIATTQIYAKVIDLKKREAIDKLPEL